MALQKQAIPLKFGGLDGKTAAKGAPFGRWDIFENMFAILRTDGGIEARKRAAFVNLSTSIAGGGSISVGRQLAELGDELVMTDGAYLRSWSPTTSKWITRGKCPGVTAQIDAVDALLTVQPSADCVYNGGYELHVSSTSDTGSNDALKTTHYYVRDSADGSLVADGMLAGCHAARVVALGTKMYIFGATGNKIQAWTIDVATPTAITGPTEVSVTSDSGTLGVFDVAVDAGRSKIILIYRSALATLVIRTLSSALAQVAHIYYADLASAPDVIGILKHDYINGHGYVGIATNADGIRLVKWDASGMTAVESDTSMNAVDQATQITGYFTVASSTANVFWTLLPGEGDGDLRIKANSGGTEYTVMRGVGLASRAFLVGTRWCFMAAYDVQALASGGGDGVEKNLYLIQIDPDSSTAVGGYLSVAGMLMSFNGGGLPERESCLGGPAVLASDRVALAYPRVESQQAPTATVSEQTYSLQRIDLRFNESLTSKAAVFGDCLHIPGAAGLIYDGKAVYEAGFFVNPAAPSASGTTGGAMTPGSTVEYCVVFARKDRSGRLWRSAPGPVLTKTLGPSDSALSVDVPTCRVTNSGAVNLSPAAGPVLLELYRTKDAGENFFLVGIAENDPTADKVTFLDEAADTAIDGNEVLYTDGAVDNIKPPAPNILCVWNGRLWAASGQGDTWFTQDAEEGLGACFSADLRVVIDDADGPIDGLIPLDTSIVIAKKGHVYPLGGPGPDREGGGSVYAPPLPMSSPTGLLQARDWAETPDGILIRTAEGNRMLTRGFDMIPVEGADPYDSLTVSAGLATLDRPFAVFATAEGRVLIWDHQLKAWYTWINSTKLAAVAACLWQGKIALLASDGTVRVEQAGSYADDGNTAITAKLEASWLNLSNAHVYQIQIVGDFLATFTLSGQTSYDWDPSTIATAKTFACTAATVSPLVLVPNRALCESLQVLLQETSTTAGFRLAQMILEVGVKPGLRKGKSGSYLA